MRFAALFILLATACTEHGKGGGSGPFPDGGSGSICGGLGGDACSADEFCDFARNTCGATDETGVCRKRPTSCDDSFEPVCSCDGLVHSNPCDAQAAGADLDAFGQCKVPPGQFKCGFRQCSVTGEFCAVAGSDIGNEPDSFACNALPGCPSQFPNCQCLVDQNIPCADISCTGDAQTGLTVTCPGG